MGNPVSGSFDEAQVMMCTGSRETYRPQLNDMNNGTWADRSDKTGHECAVAVRLLVQNHLAFFFFRYMINMGTNPLDECHHGETPRYRPCWYCWKLVPATGL